MRWIWAAIFYFLLLFLASFTAPAVSFEENFKLMNSIILFTTDMHTMSQRRVCRRGTTRRAACYWLRSTANKMPAPLPHYYLFFITRQSITFTIKSPVTVRLCCGGRSIKLHFLLIKFGLCQDCVSNLYVPDGKTQMFDSIQTGSLYFPSALTTCRLIPLLISLDAKLREASCFQPSCVLLKTPSLSLSLALSLL